MSRSRNSRRGSKKARNLGPCGCFLCTGRNQPERQRLRAPRVPPVLLDVERGEVHDYDTCDPEYFDVELDDEVYELDCMHPSPLQATLLEIIASR